MEGSPGPPAYRLRSPGQYGLVHIGKDQTAVPPCSICGFALHRQHSFSFRSFLEKPRSVLYSIGAPCKARQDPSKRKCCFMHITEGYMPYLGFRTYYRVVEPDTPNPAHLPIVLLHGGPGSTHNYLEVLDGMADRDQRTLVMYDQIGCGRSWDDAMAERGDLWQDLGTWDHELIALREHLGLAQCHLLGQSWGGMLAIEYLCDYHPEGIASVVLSSTLASSPLWDKEHHRCLKYLLPEEQEAVHRADASGNYDTPEFRAAEAHFMDLFCAGPVTEDSPECLRRPKRAGRESYLATQGDNEISVTGIFRTWDYSEKIAGIAEPALVISGTDDLCTPLIAKQMADTIPHARWELFEGCRHMCYVEDTEKYEQVLSSWLDEHDPEPSQR